MKPAAATLLFIAGLIFGAIVHDMDMVRNFNKAGDAKAWTGEIKK